MAFVSAKNFITSSICSFLEDWDGVFSEIRQVRGWFKMSIGIRALPWHFASASAVNNIGAFIRIGFWGPLCYNYSKEPPKTLLVII